MYVLQFFIAIKALLYLQTPIFRGGVLVWMTSMVSQTGKNACINNTLNRATSDDPCIFASHRGPEAGAVAKSSGIERY